MKYLKKFNESGRELEGYCPDCEQDIVSDQCYSGQFECQCGRVGHVWELIDCEKNETCPDCGQNIHCYGGEFECECGCTGKECDLIKFESTLFEKAETEVVPMYGDFTIVGDYILDPIFFGEFVFDMKTKGDQACVSKYTAHPSYLSMNEVNTLIKYVIDSQLTTR